MSHEASKSPRSSSATPIKRSIPLPESSSGSIPKASSPLSAIFTPKASSSSLPVQSTPSSSYSAPSNAGGNAQSSSTQDPSSEPLRPLSMVLTSAHGEPSSIELPEIEDVGAATAPSELAKSVPQQDVKDQIGLDIDSPKMSTSWWGDKHVSRPWHDPPKRKNTIPPEQAVAFEDTRKRVAQAAASVLDTAADITHEALYLGVEFLDFVPIPGLQAAANTLLNIWDAAQDVDMNRLGCLRLTERCADILLSVREEVHEAGDQIGTELKLPLAKLEECFNDIYRFMFKQKTRPWLKRYLKRDEIRRDISECHLKLQDALALFGVSIQIRILKQVQRTEKRREHETHVLTAILASHLFTEHPEDSVATGPDADQHNDHHHPPPLVENSPEMVYHFAAAKNALGIIDESQPEILQGDDSSNIIPDLKKIHTIQNALDEQSDISDLRQLMRQALQTNSDAEILRVFQIGHQEMPDAIKTLQRALERVSSQETETPDKSSAKGVVLGKISINEGTGNQSVKGAGTVISIDSSIVEASGGSGTSATVSGSSTASVPRDTLDREFIETGIESLRRMSQGVEIYVPTWTITKYEVDRGQMIGVGFFSTVYKGTWKGRTVAIKVLADTTPRKLFQREMGIWKTLRHANVLPLYGASSATGDPPWFFVTQYLKNGTLSEHLRKIEAEQNPPGLGLASIGNASATTTPRPPGSGVRATTLPAMSPWLGVNLANGLTPTGHLTPPNSRNIRPLPRDTPVSREWDLFRFMHEIAKGMEYLHGNGVLHGDLKASNVLVDDKYRCIICDFGQSEMKTEAFRISGTHPHGTLGWQSPELMSGRSRLTVEADVWSFSITCVEIMNMGKLPWSPMDDYSVRRYVLDEDKRPPVPRYSRFNTPGFQEIVKACWQFDPKSRPSFSKISRDFKLLRKSFADGYESPSPRIPAIDEVPEPAASPSPDLRPQELPPFLKQESGAVLPDDILSDALNSEGPYSPSGNHPPNQPHRESTVATERIRMPEPVLYTPGHSTRSSSILATASRSEERIQFHRSDGYDSPPPVDEQMAKRRNERRYRLLLAHEHHKSLSLPLWEPCQVDIGAVGYLLKPEGRFVTLFNSYEPHKSDHPGIQCLPSIHGYGNVQEEVQRLPKKTAAQRAFDILIGSLTFRNSSEDIVRRPSFPLKAGHKAAILYTETTEYRYMLKLNAPKRWFQNNVDTIMRIYGHQHRIQREDLFLIIGTLKTPAYALLVSHSHPEGHARFNVYANPQIGKPWGTFTTDTDGPRGLEDSDSEEEITRLSASKVSLHGGPMEAVLLARLRFKPDATEPTSR
ncbi:putative serine/threonine-protein kinase [Psilocybe cubensis]|uniref:Serine/threonine-protein kinase n=2 Tax=Psilocybe cubensis TaxID=181762 RepID=A0ACB8GND5_PSICU|nr:putative serine/threonine-protein kinase [Psilocybe cubensis]KAH9476525.1 putative serine/threonine-protein kinase [Psilocybe cubensis]